MVKWFRKLFKKRNKISLGKFSYLGDKATYKYVQFIDGSDISLYYKIIDNKAYLLNTSDLGTPCFIGQGITQAEPGTYGWLRTN